MSSPALEQTVPAPLTQEKPWVNPSYAWFVVIVLTLAYTCSFIDRQILTLLIEPIRRDLHINDTGSRCLAALPSRFSTRPSASRSRASRTGRIAAT